MIHYLYVVAMLVCTDGYCEPKVMTDEAYSTQKHCEDRAAHLTQINPGMQFICGTVKREAP